MKSEDINAERPCGQTTLKLIALQDKISDEQIKIFKLLIDDAPKDIVSNTILLPTAALKGHGSLCQVILDKYLEAITDVDKCEHDALHIAICENRTDIINIIKAKLQSIIKDYSELNDAYENMGQEPHYFPLYMYYLKRHVSEVGFTQPAIKEFVDYANEVDAHCIGQDSNLGLIK